MVFSIWNFSGIHMDLFHGIHMDLFHGIQGGYAQIPYGIHDVHGTINWLRPQPTVIPWIPHGIPDGFHGFHMDSIRNNPGKVKTSMNCK